MGIGVCVMPRLSAREVETRDEVRQELRAGVRAVAAAEERVEAAVVDAVRSTTMPWAEIAELSGRDRKVLAHSYGYLRGRSR